MDDCQDVKIVSGDCSDAFQLMQFTGRSDTVQVDLYYEPTALSPLFDGAAWAGGMVWGCSVVLAQYVYDAHPDLHGKRAIELGCGCHGVPGIAAYLAGADTVVTEQEPTVSLLAKNVATNFKADGRANSIEARALDWTLDRDCKQVPASAPVEQHTSGSLTETVPEPAAAAEETVTVVKGQSRGERVVAERRERSAREAAREAARKKMQEDSSDEDSSEEESSQVLGWSAQELGTFDMILASDCVYEPLYGESWRALVSVMEKLSNSSTLVLIGVTRRKDDGVDDFLRLTEEQFTHVVVRSLLEKSASRNEGETIEIYQFTKK